MKTSDMNKNDGPPFSAQAQPWFVIFHGEDMKNQTFYSISEHRYHVRNIPKLRSKKICTQIDGWLVLFDYDSKDYYIWNAISGDKIQLPPSLPNTNKLECLISAPPDDPECRIMFIDVPSSIYFCKLGYDEEFHKQDLQPIIGDSNRLLWTVFRRKFYGLIGSSLESNLVHLDIIDSNRLKVTQMAGSLHLYDVNGKYLEIARREPYLIQSDDDNDMLYCVHMLYNGWYLKEPYGFLVFGYDFGTRTWVEIESIGESAIFLHDSKGITCSTTKGGSNNNIHLNRDSIYFTEGRQRRLYVYSLETKRISMSLPCPTLSKKQDSVFYWLKLPASFKDTTSTSS